MDPNIRADHPGNTAPQDELALAVSLQCDYFAVVKAKGNAVNVVFVVVVVSAIPSTPISSRTGRERTEQTRDYILLFYPMCMRPFRGRFFL